jgi:hypothetical protein
MVIDLREQCIFHFSLLLFFQSLTFQKMKKEKKVWAMTLIALWYLTPNLTFGQDSLAVSPLNEVVVTATKFPKNQSETGKVMTVISEEQLERSAGKDLSQLLNEQVGLVINGSGSNPGKDKSVYLRGAKTDYTVILLDGIPLNDPSGFGGAFDLRLIPVDQVERIEILKGSQSTLYEVMLSPVSSTSSQRKRGTSHLVCLVISASEVTEHKEETSAYEEPLSGLTIT